MTDTAMLEASLFQLKAALGAIDDPMFTTQVRLSTEVLSNAVSAAGASLSAAALNDIEFALNDVVAVVGELSAADADRVTPALEMMQKDVASLKEATALPKSVIGAIRELQSKLRIRRTAIERSTYREAGTPEEPLPHAPADLRAEALPLRQKLATAGFSTPALDDLIADPASLRFHSINEIINELDVVVGDEG